MSDILNIQPSNRVLVIKHPATGEPVGLDIEYRSLDSAEVQAVERALRNKALRNGRNTQTVDKLEDAEYAILHATVVSWRWYNGMDLGGNSNPPVTRENTERLFRSAPWVKRQYNTELGDEQGFFSSALRLSTD